jgi:hypothetical protein
VTLGQAVEASRDGALHYVCMDWRHLLELLSAGREIYDGFLNLCVWNKNNGGMGSFYRSKHELVAVFKVGTAPHINNVELGRHGRNRTNVWDYPGVNTFRPGRIDELAMHPTVKPVALIADVIKDASRRSNLVLDPFARKRLNNYCRGKDRPAGPSAGDRSALCRSDYSALAIVHGHTGAFGYDNNEL